MARYEENIDKRREKREALRRQREIEQRRLRVGLIAAVIVLALCAWGIVVIARNAPESPESVGQSAAMEATKAPTEPTQPPASVQQNTITTIHIKAAGDLNVTNATVDAGLAANGYDYTRAFMDVGSILSDADLTVLNLEGNICGEPYGTERTSAPAALLKGLRDVGVDLVQMANSCTVNNGINGLAATLQAVRDAGLVPMGAYATEAEFRQSKGYTLCDVQGVKVAFVAFTKGLGGRGLPSGSEDCVNLLYVDYATEYSDIDQEGITAVLKDVANEDPDIVIAMLHWGSEYDDVISDSQKSIVSLMQKNGVDVIIGTHPHTVQKIDFDQAAGTLVAYSLGDFFGDAVRGGTNYSIILDVEITKDSASGTTRVTDFSYTPIYTVKETQCVDQDRRVVRIEQAMIAYENNFVDKIIESCNSDMAYSLTRIEDRVNPKTEDEKK